MNQVEIKAKYLATKTQRHKDKNSISQKVKGFPLCLGALVAN
jgi:hypothetical protein